LCNTAAYAKQRLPVNGDQVRNVTFPRRGGYRAADVDDLLTHVAAELDAGRPADPLIANATFQSSRFFFRGDYDCGAVDWFLDQLRRREDPSEAARSNADPWGELAAEPYCIRREPGGPAMCIAAPSAQEYADGWRGFGQQPGTRLRWEKTGAMRGYLRTADQTLASCHAPASFLPATLSAAGRSFTLKYVTKSAWPGIAETISPDWLGEDRMVPRQPGDRDPALRQLIHETGIAVLYCGGRHFNRSAGSYIKFPGHRWLRFPVRGTKPLNTIMTAVDQAGNKVARYRITPHKHQWWTDVSNTVEIIVHPSQRLTEELALVLALSAPWLFSYFATPRGG
jgi:DivIVA domain-containing protein